MAEPRALSDAELARLLAAHRVQSPTNGFVAAIIAAAADLPQAPAGNGAWHGRATAARARRWARPKVIAGTAALLFAVAGAAHQLGRLPLPDLASLFEPAPPVVQPTPATVAEPRKLRPVLDPAARPKPSTPAPSPAPDADRPDVQTRQLPRPIVIAEAAPAPPRAPLARAPAALPATPSPVERPTVSAPRSRTVDLGRSSLRPFIEARPDGVPAFEGRREVVGRLRDDRPEATRPLREDRAVVDATPAVPAEITADVLSNRERPRLDRVQNEALRAQRDRMRALRELREQRRALRAQRRR